MRCCPGPCRHPMPSHAAMPCGRGRPLGAPTVGGGCSRDAADLACRPDSEQMTLPPGRSSTASLSTKPNHPTQPPTPRAALPALAIAHGWHRSEEPCEEPCERRGNLRPPRPARKGVVVHAHVDVHEVLSAARGGVAPPPLLRLAPLGRALTLPLLLSLALPSPE